MTETGGSDAMWRPPADGGSGADSAGRAWPPPRPPWPGPPPARAPVTDELAAGHRRRWWLVLVGSAAVAATIAGAVVVFFVLRGPEVRRTDLATIQSDEVRFDDVELAAGVVISRTWRIDGRRLRSSATVRNRTDARRWVVYDETVPAPLTPRVEASAIRGPAGQELTDSIARFTQELGAGRAMRITYEVALAQPPSLDELEAWTAELDQAFRAHLADAELSPLDGDIDGIPDVLDACVTEAGPVGGCPDTDGDGVADPDDSCELEPGPLEGCPDRDDDDVADAEDECPDEAGPLAGCPDADGDGRRDMDDRCRMVAGPVAGCPDEDDDRFGDGFDDECIGEPGPVHGCPDRDADGRADAEDQCATIAGDYAGCPDVSDVRWAIFNAFDHHIMRLSALPPSFDPDGDQLVEDGRGYCAEVRGSFERLRTELDAAVSGPPAGASADTVALARTASQSAAINIGLLDACLDQDVPFPWEDPDSGWTNGCRLADELVERVTGQAYECNSTW